MVRGNASWVLRRRTIYATLIYCAVVILYLALFATDTVLRQQIAVALIGLAGACIGCWVFGATWHDINNMKGDPECLPSLSEPPPGGVLPPES